MFFCGRPDKKAAGFGFGSKSWTASLQLQKEHISKYCCIVVHWQVARRTVHFYLSGEVQSMNREGNAGDEFAGNREVHGRFHDENGNDSGHNDGSNQELLERVLQETINADNLLSLKLISDVAAHSEYGDSTSIAAVMEVVQAIVDRRFGPNRIGRGLVRRVAHSLSESPEACIRLERIWQEARHGQS